MAKDQDRLRRGLLGHVQKLAMHGLSGSEIESGAGNDGIRFIGPRTVLPAYADIRRHKRTAGHGDGPQGCLYCVERLRKTIEVIQVPNGREFTEMVQDTGTDETETDTPTPADWWANS